MPDPDRQHAARLAAHRTVSTHLSALDDRELGNAVAAAAPLGVGIGGRSAVLDVGGTRIFVKRVPLTELESRPEHIRSTANLFGLPTFYQYGFGSSGFGAWRELAVHTMTTSWVLADEYPGFPLLYHWRVLPDSPPEGFADELGGVDRAVGYWEGSPAVRERLEAIGRSPASLVLFLEHLPGTLSRWLRDHAATWDGSPYPWVEEALAAGTAFMSSRGLVHFDAHFGNILTDGRLLYFADFGLALSTGFELSETEAGFLADHLRYDRCYTMSSLLHRILDGVRGGTGREEFLRGWIAGRRPGGVPDEVAAIVGRHARSTLVIDGFHHRLHTESRRTPFPAADIERALGPGY